jgi:rhodanese-related sulfurtransferase
MQQIDVTQLEAALDSGATVVDVREPMEFAQAHVPGAVSIPMAKLPARMAELDKSETIHVICATGGRSSAMADLLSAAGYNAVNVAGGTMAWLRSGRPTVSELVAGRV